MIVLRVSFNRDGTLASEPEMLDATFQLQQAEIHLLRQTGQLETWIQSVGHAQTSAPIKP